jgi:hypothetical protein
MVKTMLPSEPLTGPASPDHCVRDEDVWEQVRDEVVPLLNHGVPGPNVDGD